MTHCQILDRKWMKGRGGGRGFIYPQKRRHEAVLSPQSCVFLSLSFQPDSLLNGGGDALSLFDHNQSLSGAPTTNSNGDNHSIASSSSLGLLPVSCDIGSGLGSVVGSLSSCGIGEGAADLPSHPPPPPPPPRSASGDDEDEEEDGGTTEGCLTDDDENDATIDAEHQFQQPNGSTAMEKSTLYPNQSLPPPVYTNISKLQAAAQRAVGVKDPQDAPRSQCSSSSTQPHDTTTSSAGDSTFANGRKFSQPTATISKGGMHSLLRSLSISGRPVVMPPPTSHAVDESLGAGEGLGLSPPSTTSMTPVIADQAPSAPGSPSSAYAQARSRLDAIFSNVESSGLRRAQTTRAESPSHPPSAIDIAGGGGVGGGCGASEVDGDVGNASTFHRRRPHQQQQRTAGINLMRGSMFQLNTTSAPPDSDFANSVDSRYGYASKQQPMTPGPGRRAPLRTQLSTANEPVQTIRPPRRSSSVCRELPSLAQQSRPQPQQQQQQTHYGSASHYAAPRGAQQHPQRVYADPRAFQQQQQQHHQQQPQPQNGVPTTPAAAAQLAAEAAARRHQQQQQYAAASGLRPAVGNRTMSPTQNGVVVGQSRLPQRQAGVASGNAHGPMAARSKNQKPAPHQFYGQQHQQQTGIPAASSASSSPSTSSCAYYGAPQQYHHHQLQQQQQQQHHYPPPPAAFDDVESTSFIEAPPPPPPQ
uniref:IMD domain-containing protein n=1 Tax=Mesocestoides corti TaxID=53468 RepID=A0A5K3FJC6_MESCO